MIESAAAAQAADDWPRNSQARLVCTTTQPHAKPDYPVYQLTTELLFPPPEWANPEGIVALGGDLSPGRLILAYSQGIFPWPHEGLPLLWFSPDPRFVIDVSSPHVGRSLRKTVRRGQFDIRVDTNFRAVMLACQRTPRPGQDGTWITRDMLEGYCALHEKGLAHSIETYQNGELVGGLYGISLGGSFCGESMFATAPEASKVATVALLGHLKHWGFHFLDCQVHTEHLERFGAKEWPRTRYLKALRTAVAEPTRTGPWTFELSPEQALAVLGTT